MKRSLIAVLAIISLSLSVALVGYGYRIVTAQRPSLDRHGLQSDGTFIGPNGKFHGSLREFVDSGARCGTKDQRLRLIRTPSLEASIQALAPAAVTINVYFHVIQQTAGSSGTGFVPMSWINSQ